MMFDGFMFCFLSQCALNGVIVVVVLVIKFITCIIWPILMQVLF